ncbi:MAG: DUF930 domain-containing protein [Arenimonas sp.]|nr:DUF930 domain-containing protein [Arenimonas sp.]
MINMPEPISQPAPEESVTVEIVPPPEEPQPEPAKAEEAQPAPEPPADEQAEAPPPPQSVPTPPERPVEQPPAEQPPEEAAGEPAPEEQTPEDAAGAPAPTMPVLRPVIQFGEKDAGPRQDTSGNAVEEAAKPAEVPPEESEPPTDKPESAPTEEENTAEADAPAGAPLPDDITIPEIDAVATGDAGDGPIPVQQTAETTVTLTQDRPADKTDQPVARSEDPAAPVDEAVQPTAALDEVTTLYSTSLTGDPAAMTAMGDIPRPDRADQLCVTELREQLRHGTPTYRPELLPSFQLKDGDVLTVNKAAFRANGQWFNLRFRCEIDPDATRVLSFAFEVGAAIPKSDWKRYGFPEF